MPSSVIRNFNYDPETKSLKITFVTGLVYCYKNVPKSIFKLFRASVSKGRYFNFFIKDKFKFQKVN